MVNLRQSNLAQQGSNPVTLLGELAGQQIEQFRVRRRVVRMMLIDQMKGKNTPTVVLGDLNDDPHSNTVNLMTDQPTMTKNSTGSTDALYSTLFLQQMQSFRDVFYTHEYKNHKGVLDHILVSEEFFEGSKNSKWSHKETSIWNDHIEDDDPYTSDHGIVKSSFV